MEPKHSWWQQIKRPVLVIGIIVAFLLGIALIVGIIGGYLFHWGWTGITTKTLWDWLQLLGILAIPVVVGFGAVWFTVRHNHDREIARMQYEADREIAADNQSEAALQAYIDSISELLLKEHLGELTPEGKPKPEYEEVRTIARVRTLTVLPRLNAKRKKFVLMFLYDSHLIFKDNTIIGLHAANLRGANLHRNYFPEANLREAQLDGADLSRVLQ